MSQRQTQHTALPRSALDAMMHRILIAVFTLPAVILHFLTAMCDLLLELHVPGVITFLCKTHSMAVVVIAGSDGDES